MASFKIYSSDGNSIRYEGKPRYVSNFGKPSYLEFSEIDSPTPIQWTIGDYAEYRGRTFRLKVIPKPKKQARRGSYGGSFVYSGIHLYDDSYDLQIALFLDIVTDDNGVHFSSSESFSTFENVSGIAARIQANLNLQYPSSSWVVSVYNGASIADIVAQVKEVSISNGSKVIDILDEIYNQWGLGWVHTYSSGVNTITIGRPNVQDDGNTTSVFLYGRNHGLRAIQVQVSSQNEIATRLYAYGNTKNMIPRYYNNKSYVNPVTSETSYIKNNQSANIPNLMLPFVKDNNQIWRYGADGIRDASKCYIEDDEAVSKFGVIPKIVYFNGSNDVDDIFPSIQGMTYGQLLDAMPSGTKYRPSSADRTVRVDKLRSVVASGDSGLLANASGKSTSGDGDITPSLNFTTDTYDVQDEEMFVEREFTTDTINIAIISVGGKVDFAESYHIFETSVDDLIYIADFIKAEFVLYSGGNEVKRIDMYSIGVPSNNGDKFQFTVPAFAIDLAASSVLTAKLHIIAKVNEDAMSLEGVEQYSFTLTNRQSVTMSYVISSVDISEYAEVTLHQIGFNLADYLVAGASNYGTLSFKSGKCAGREFSIKSVSPTSDDGWKLTLERALDTDLNQYFPNNLYDLATGDEFVILDITMPEVYLSAAEQKLYSAAKSLLDDLAKPKMAYELEINAKSLAENPEILEAGMYLPVEDADVIEPSTIEGQTRYIDFVLIDSLFIDEGESSIPTYKITLRDEKRKTFIQRITNSLLKTTRTTTGERGERQTIEEVKTRGGGSFIPMGDVQYVFDKVDELKDGYTFAQYPTARSVYNALLLKADKAEIPDGVYIVNFEVTTSGTPDAILPDKRVSDIQDAIDDGLAVLGFLSDGGEVYQAQLAYIYGDECIFSVAREDGLYLISYVTADTCNGSSLNQETKNNKVASVSSSSTDVQYPSAKCLYDRTKYSEETFAILLTDWSASSGTVPFTKTCTVSPAYSIGSNTEIELVNDNPIGFAKSGIVLYSVQNNTITFLAMEASQITVKVRFREKL